MYDQNFRNQAVKECVNGQTLKGTARKYGISDTALRKWVNEYKKKIAAISEDSTERSTIQLEVTARESIFQLMSINVNIDGHELTISKDDVRKIMDIFHQFDE